MRRGEGLVLGGLPHPVDVGHRALDVPTLHFHGAESEKGDQPAPLASGAFSHIVGLFGYLTRPGQVLWVAKTPSGVKLLAFPRLSEGER